MLIKSGQHFYSSSIVQRLFSDTKPTVPLPNLFCVLLVLVVRESVCVFALIIFCVCPTFEEEKNPNNSGRNVYFAVGFHSFYQVCTLLRICGFLIAFQTVGSISFGVVEFDVCACEPVCYVSAAASSAHGVFTVCISYYYCPQQRFSMLKSGDGVRC